MTFWKQVSTRPAGALPQNLVTKAGALLLMVLLVGLIVSVSFGGGGEDEAAPGVDPAGQQTMDEGVGLRLQSQVTEQERREELGRDAAERQAERERISAAALEGLQGAGVMEGEEMLVFDPETGAVLDPDEGELRRGLRLEEIERRFRSLRAGPVVLSLRDPDAAGVPGDIAGLIEQALQDQRGGLGGNPILDLLTGLPPEAFADDLTGGPAISRRSPEGATVTAPSPASWTPPFPPWRRGRERADSPAWRWPPMTHTRTRRGLSLPSTPRVGSASTRGPLSRPCS